MSAHRAEREPWTRARILVAVLAAGSVLVGGSVAWAKATPLSEQLATQLPPPQVSCTPGQALVILPGGTWACYDWPVATPSATATPTVTTPAPTTPAATTPAPVTPTPTPSKTTTAAPTSVAPTTVPPTTPPVTTMAPSPTAPGPHKVTLPTIQAYMTGYSWYDNDPPGSTAIAYPNVRKANPPGAGGLGTFDNPITMATVQGEWPQGTKFYSPNLRRYFIVEDTCYGCDNPPSGASTWLDVWVDGRAMSNSAADQCMGKITKVTAMVTNPPGNLLVVSGLIASAGGCTQQFGNDVYAVS